MSPDSDKQALTAAERKRIRRRRIAKPLVRYLGSPLLRLYSSLWRKSLVYENDAARDAVQNGCLAVLWHGRGLSLLPVFRGHKASILVSPGDDGRLIADLLESWGFETISGSTRHGASAALREMLGVLREGRNIVVTPDGPPGPAHTVTAAMAFLSRGTGFPVVPLGMGIHRAWRLSSYDRYTIPKPFARVTSFVGEPIQVPREARGEEAQAQWTETIRQALLRAEERAFEELGIPFDL